MPYTYITFAHFTTIKINIESILRGGPPIKTGDKQVLQSLKKYIVNHILCIFVFFICKESSILGALTPHSLAIDLVSSPVLPLAGDITVENLVAARATRQLTFILSSPELLPARSIDVAPLTCGENGLLHAVKSAVL